MRQAHSRVTSRHRRIAAGIAAAALAAGLTGLVAPATMASAPSDRSGTEQPNPPGHEDGKDDPHQDDGPKCDSNGYDHDHYDECGAEPAPAPPAPAPQPAAYDPNPAPPYVAGYLLPVKVAPVQPASIYTGYIDCGSVVDEPGEVTTAGAEVRRLSDASGDGCTPAEYALDTDEKSVRFLKAGSPFAQFVMTVVWRSELKIPQTAATYVDFELVDGGYELEAPICPASLYENNKLVGLPSLKELTPEALAGYGITDMDGLPSAPAITTDNGITQYACVGEKSNKFVGGEDPHYELTQEMYILGDIYIRR